MQGVDELPSHYGTFLQGRPLWARVVGLAETQHGVVSLAQLLELGVSASAARGWVQRGRLRRVHRGVYTVAGARLSARGSWLAAVLASGPGAVLSHRSAAALWGLRADNRPTADITVGRPGSHSRPGITVHASDTLRAEHVTVRDGIPCSTVARTLLDLAEAVTLREVERAVEQAEVLRLYDQLAVDDVLAGAHGRRGAPILSSVLNDLNAPTLTESELEERFLALCRRAGLPQPEVGVWLTLAGSPVKLDFLFRAQRLVVETDGHRYHRTRQAFERDRLRDQRLVVAGLRVLRFTWRQIVRGEPHVTGTLQAAARLARP